MVIFDESLAMCYVVDK